MLVFLLNTNGKWGKKCNYNERELSVVLQEAAIAVQIFLFMNIFQSMLYI